MIDDFAAALADAKRAHAYLRAIIPSPLRIGPFTLRLSERDASIYSNYAIPDDDAAPSAADVAALIAAFVAHERTPRFEYAPVAAPAVEAALLTAGFDVELRPPLMTRRPDVAITRVAPPTGFSLLWAEEGGDLGDVVAIQRAAFGEPPLSGAPDMRMQRHALRRGGRYVLARSTNGAPAGAGAYTPPRDGVTEVVGVGVLPAFRRRGLACAIADALARSAFTHGCEMAFLSAAGPQQAAIYARAGFVERLSMLFIAKR
jgi:ribosomal protein S18 acetylase RimI-like enzyme